MVDKSLNLVNLLFKYKYGKNKIKKDGQTEATVLPDSGD